MTHSATLPILLKQLHLTTMVRHWETLLMKAGQEHWSPDQYLTTLCEQELTERYSRRIDRLTRESRLPAGKTLSSFNFSQTPDLPPGKIQNLADRTDWVKRAENLLLFGPSGVGKTHLAAAVGYGLIQQGLPVRYLAAVTIMQELQRARKELQMDIFLNKLDKYPVIILDDIGYVKKTEFETQALFELIAHRYESGSMIVTANHPFSQWDHIFTDSVMTVAAIDRLVHHSVIIEINAESYRKNQAVLRHNFTRPNETTITNHNDNYTQPGGNEQGENHNESR
jgi:DNA replication protein DnaC